MTVRVGHIDRRMFPTNWDEAGLAEEPPFSERGISGPVCNRLLTHNGQPTRLVAKSGSGGNVQGKGPGNRGRVALIRAVGRRSFRGIPLCTTNSLP